MIRTGFFGGTFDPIHYGHLNLAINLLEAHHLDQVFFCPANCSPDKENHPPFASQEMRRKMVELAIQEIPQFILCSLEIERKGPSYTIDTIRMLKDQYTDHKFFLILGEDMLQAFSNWKEVDALVELCQPLVGTRPSILGPSLPPSLQKKIDKGKTPINQMEISSTDLRKRLKEKKYCGHLLPSKVLGLIEEEGVY